jgi:predicted AAA+ superfamily ATPase
MKRNISKKLMAWKDSSSRKPLIIRGARQVGKTYTVKEFGSEHFSNVVVLDFERDRSLNAVFEKDLDPKKLLIELEIHTGSRIIPGETLLFFDEIQACERALLSLRYFYEEMPELHIIALVRFLNLQ